jgi:hypothetical protein
MHPAEIAKISIAIPFLLRACRRGASGKNGIRKSGVKNSNENRIASTTCFRVAGALSVIQHLY